MSQSQSLTLGEALILASAELKKSGICEYSREARSLVCHVFEIGAVELISNAASKTDKRQIANLLDLISRRRGGESIGRITGEVEFYGLQFKISENTLEPRTDTETLIDVVLADFQHRNGDIVRILDIGTGTGAIIVSLLYNMPAVTGVATDINQNTLDMAKQNAVANGVDDRIKFIDTNWCADIDEDFDVIVSNPPYIRSEVIPTLAREVKDCDPLIALDGGDDGLDAYREIFTQCSQKIVKTGKLYLEIGYDQAELICGLAKQANWKFVRLIKDSGANDRVLVFEP
ncbi:MAG: peptide chain release factor N(5)-glutamine methyltransferase [Hyphomicrobiales bacterium]|nr:peptide chain release factor N(5)-glutamine methyltransferase [Hyphomicrobiales bacterium]